MKKALLAMLILCLLFWTAGCGEQNEMETDPYLAVPEYVGASTDWVKEQLGEPTNIETYQMAGSNASSQPVTKYTYDTEEDRVILDFIDDKVVRLDYSVRTDPYIPFNFDNKAEIFNYFAITPGADMQLAVDEEYSAMFSNVTADILQVNVQFAARETQSCSFVSFVFDEAFLNL